MEFVLSDLAAADPEWRRGALRYFNLVAPTPAGASAKIQRSAQQPDALCEPGGGGRLPQLRVFGGDYPTPDGTGVRDYIHVVDLAVGHVAAVRRLAERSGRADGQSWHRRAATA